LTLTARLLIRCAEAASAWSPLRRLAVAILGFMLVGLMERAGGIFFNVTFFYLLACAGAILCLGERWGMVVSTIGACLSAFTRHAQLHGIVQDISPWLELWALAARLLSFGFLAVLVRGLKGVLLMERWRADHDGLTHALNKRAFEALIAVRTAAARQAGHYLIFAYMDLDGFKAVNDRHGHAAGDRVLQLFAAAAERSIRHGDLFARIGGDEFALLLSLPPKIDGDRVAELLHARLTTILRGSGLPVTCSMGALIVSPDRMEPTAALFEQADALMYEVKRNGKDGVRISHGGPFAPARRPAYPPLPDAGSELERLLAGGNGADRDGPGGHRRIA
jgi:diguanylate cyclase (GGDEF)-like protein